MPRINLPPLLKHKKPTMPITLRERLFVEEYIATQNGTQSAIKAGYSKDYNTAAQKASQLLRKPKIKRLIKKALDRIWRKSAFKTEEVLERVKEISDVDVGKCFDKRGALKSLKNIPLHVRRAISSIETEEITRKGIVVGVVRKIKFWDKTKALEMSGKHLKLWEDGNKAPPVNQSVVVVLPAKTEDAKKGN